MGDNGLLPSIFTCFFEVSSDLELLFGWLPPCIKIIIFVHVQNFKFLFLLLVVLVFMLCGVFYYSAKLVKRQYQDGKYIVFFQT